MNFDGFKIRTMQKAMMVKSELSNTKSWFFFVSFLNQRTFTICFHSTFHILNICRLKDNMDMMGSYDSCGKPGQDVDSPVK